MFLEQPPATPGLPKCGNCEHWTYKFVGLVLHSPKYISSHLIPFWTRKLPLTFFFLSRLENICPPKIQKVCLFCSVIYTVYCIGIFSTLVIRVQTNTCKGNLKNKKKKTNMGDTASYNVKKWLQKNTALTIYIYLYFFLQ